VTPQSFDPTTFAHVTGGLWRRGVELAQKQGIAIEDISDPATRNYNLIRVPKPGT
jgi:hypothetical protein